MKHSFRQSIGVAAGLLVLGAASTVLGSDALPAAVSAAPGGAGPTAAGSHGGGGAMDYVATLFVFMLATFVGLDVIRRVSRLLHTPLMSLTNAISAIAVVGSILIAGQQHGDRMINVLGLIAIVASVTNIVSGFLITDRMLKMFKKREEKKP